jgi:hypothetical protein
MPSIKSNVKSFKLTEGNGWIRKAAIIAAKDKQAELESKWPLPENFSAKDINIVRVRTLSGLI